VADMSHFGTTNPTTGQRLNLEWTRLRTRPEALRRASGWSLTDDPVANLDEILAAVGFETLRTRDAELRLRRLVILAAGDELAGRVVVQRLLPGLLAVVRKRRRGGFGHAVLDELLATLWISIRTYNPDRDPTCIAAALISDADYRAFRASTRRRSSTERPTDIDDSTPIAERTPSASDELAELLSDAIEAGVPNEDIELVRQLVGARRAIDLANQLNVTPRTIRNRRDRVTDRLREVALVA